jgi:hypothetical protein
MLASPAGSKVVTPGFARLAHFVSIAAIVVQTATHTRCVLTRWETRSWPLTTASPEHILRSATGSVPGGSRLEKPPDPAAVGRQNHYT